MRKAASAAVLLAMGFGSVAAVKNSAGLKSWVEEISGTEKIVSAGVELQPGGGESASVLSGGMILTAPRAGESEESFPPFPTEVEIPQTQAEVSEPPATVLPTTIDGGMVIRNDTSFDIDLGAMLREGPGKTLPRDGIQVLIIHTHGSEAFTPDEENSYTPSDTYRSDDKRYSVVRLGDELASCFESYGISVIHDRETYDYPSYTGSYGRSASAIEGYLAEHPEIAIVIDLHRDALGSGGVIYKTVAEGGGKASSQVMLLVGTGENGLAHPNWRENMKLAMYLQSALVEKYPSLARPVAVKKERYNQQLTTGSLILEVGSSGNTLSEALQAVRLFAEATAPALLKLVE